MAVRIYRDLFDKDIITIEVNKTVCGVPFHGRSFFIDREGMSKHFDLMECIDWHLQECQRQVDALIANKLEAK